MKKLLMLLVLSLLALAACGKTADSTSDNAAATAAPEATAAAEATPAAKNA